MLSVSHNRDEISMLRNNDVPIVFLVYLVEDHFRYPREKKRTSWLPRSQSFDHPNLTGNTLLFDFGFFNENITAYE